MRILALTRYEDQGPSSRVRFYQYLPYLKSQEIEVQLAPLLDNNYIRNLYTGKRTSALSVLRSYLQRIGWLLRSSSFDLLWIEKELLPWFPAWAESLLARAGVPYVVDYDDAVFHRYDMHTSGVVRAFLGNSIDRVMRHSTVVVAGNEYLAERARQVGAKRIEYLPSVVDANQYSVSSLKTDDFRIGWIGSPITAPYLDLIRPALQDVIQQTGARLVLIGAGQIDPLPGVPNEIHSWSLDREVGDIQSMEIGIMPLPDLPFERGKCGYKLIQYMACGLPVVASPVGVNAQIVDHEKTGFLASSTQEWKDALLRLYDDAALRQKMGKAGRKKVEEKYSLQVAAPRLLEILGSV